MLATGSVLGSHTRTALGKASVGCVGACVLFQSVAGAQNARDDIAVFTSVQASEYHELESNPFHELEFTPALDIVYSRSRDHSRIFGELLLTDYEQELERLQVGWQLSEGTTLWVGRFHDPASHWSSEHHHGQYLQTTIFRPAIEEFEDLGGVLPTHTTGVLLERRDEIGSAALRTSLSAGLSGQFTGTEIEPFDLLDPESGHETGVTVRLALYPDALGDNYFGISLSNHDVGLADGVMRTSCSMSVYRREIEVAVIKDKDRPELRNGPATSRYRRASPMNPRGVLSVRTPLNRPSRRTSM